MSLISGNDQAGLKLDPGSKGFKRSRIGRSCLSPACPPAMLRKAMRAWEEVSFPVITKRAGWEEVARDGAVVLQERNPAPNLVQE